LNFDVLSYIIIIQAASNGKITLSWCMYS